MAKAPTILKEGKINIDGWSLSTYQMFVIAKITCHTLLYYLLPLKYFLALTPMA